MREGGFGEGFMVVGGKGTGESWEVELGGGSAQSIGLERRG